MANESELEEFINDFKIQRAECIIKQVYQAITGVVSLPYCEHALSSEQHPTTCLSCYPPPPPLPSHSPPAILVNKAVFHIACEVLKRFLKVLDIHYLDDVDEDILAVVSGAEWEILNFDVFNKHMLPPAPPESEYSLYQPKADLNNISAKELKKFKALVRKEQSIRTAADADIATLQPVDETMLQTLHTLLLGLRDQHGAQAKINGNFAASKNICKHTISIPNPLLLTRAMLCRDCEACSQESRKRHLCIHGPTETTQICRSWHNY